MKRLARDAATELDELWLLVDEDDRLEVDDELLDDRLLVDELLRLDVLEDDRLEVDDELRLLLLLCDEVDEDESDDVELLLRLDVLDDDSSSATAQLEPQLNSPKVHEAKDNVLL